MINVEKLKSSVYGIQIKWDFKESNGKAMT